MKKTQTNDEILEKVVAHFTKRIREGKRPSIEKYKRQFPHLSDDIEELLTSVAMIEGLKQDSAPENSMQKRISETLKLERLGDYRIIRELGRGGMGIVFEAVHESLGRRVALKVLPTRSLDDERRLERFRREAQAAAKLHHTNIVSVFGVGMDSDYHYYVMEYVDGCGLNDIIRSYRNDKTKSNSRGTVADNTVIGLPGSKTLEGPTLNDADESTRIDVNSQTDSAKVNLEIRESDRYQWTARIGSQIADALATAHRHHILHRDIKPSNLLLDNSGSVWIADFGLAKNLTNQDMTKTGDILGTPRYLAPESLEGKYDERSEVYCLGLTLYEMATLRPAYTENSTPELIRKITSTSPPSPRKIDPAIPADLNTIIEKAIAKDPDQRYQTATELRNDLRAFREDRPIAARRASMIEQAWRWRRRNPLVASLAAASIILLGLVAATASFGYWHSTRAYAQLEIQNKSLETAKSKIESEYGRAEKNVALALEMFDEMFTQILAKGDEDELGIRIANLSDEEGFEELSNIRSPITAEDALFLERMLEFYERFADENANNKSLQRESANAFRRVGNLYQMSNEPDKAPAFYKKAMDLYESIIADATDMTPDQKADLTLAIVRTRNELGMYYKSLGVNRKKLAEQAEQEFWASRRQLEALDRPDLEEAQFELAKTMYHLATSILRLTAAPTEIAKRRANRTEGDDYTLRNKIITKKSMDILDELIEQHPDETKYRVFQSDAQTQLAIWAIRVEKDAEPANQIIERLEEQIKQFPDVHEFRFMLCQVYANQNPTVGKNIESLERAHEICKSLVDEFPWNNRYRKFLIDVSFGLIRSHRFNVRMIERESRSRDGRITAEAKQRAAPHKAEAEALSLQVTQLSETLADSGESSFQIFHQMKVAKSLFESGQYEESKALVVKSIEMIEQGNAQHLARLMRAHLPERDEFMRQPMGKSRWRNQNPNRARRMNAALDEADRIVANRFSSENAVLAMHYALLAVVCNKLDQPEEARQARAQANKYRMRVRRGAPNPARFGDSRPPVKNGQQ